MNATVTGWGCYPSRLNDWGCQGKPVFTAGQDFCHNSFRIGDKNTQTSGLDGGVGVGGVWGWGYVGVGVCGGGVEGEVERADVLGSADWCHQPLGHTCCPLATLPAGGYRCTNKCCLSPTTAMTGRCVDVFIQESVFL